MEQPLVSVIVVCYNAADYIVETLESIKEQTYKNLELIVSDDFSKDGTADIAKEWMKENGGAFVRTEVITVDHNTGVSANYNRAVRECRGEWIKNVDGDDLITANCIQDNLQYVFDHPECLWVFSQVQKFSSNGGDRVLQEFFFNEERKKIFSLDSFEQFKYLLVNNPLPSQSCFINARLLKENPYNESYRGLEDAPMWLNLARKGIKAHYFDKCTALYRLSESMTVSNQRYFSSIYFESMQKFFWMEKFNYIKQYDLEEAYNLNRRFLLKMEFADVILGNKKSKLNDIIFNIGKRFIDKRCFHL